MQVSSLEDVQTSDQMHKAGRPRSEESHRAILDATRRLLTHNSVAKLSVEAIAKKAGVGKTTIYRWWPNKQAVVMDAVFSQPGFHNILPASASSFDGVRAQVDKLMRQLSGKNGRVVAEIIGEAQGDPEALKNLVENFFQDRYNALAGYLEQGKDSGEFPADLDIEAAIDVILGPIVFRLMTGQDFDAAFEENVSLMLRKALAA
ncbi:MAG: TetR/AcrR family transcriptional regulator [Rhodospirillales bacterium]|nr:TetR/AcrR family transcriptional regulator [Alphaproteobacteria bacterium]USO03765.1 MAG: TetR/AcrR family transcriptional regulator [Rhodospirillales bacterium]